MYIFVLYKVYHMCTCNKLSSEWPKGYNAIFRLIAKYYFLDKVLYYSIAF
jgi:hypothetical protein